MGGYVLYVEGGIVSVNLRFEQVYGGQSLEPGVA